MKGRAEMDKQLEATIDLAIIEWGEKQTFDPTGERLAAYIAAAVRAYLGSDEVVDEGER